MPAITVILPCYNGANYLRESIDSILAQSFTDFELHVLDDGSTDDSAAIAKSYPDSRVRYSKNEGRFGLFKTLNRGIREAKTPWVRIWAHDDRMTKDGLERFHQFSQRHPEVGMIYCRFREMDGEGKFTGRDTLFDGQWERTPDVANADQSALLFFAFGCLPGNISTVMVRRSAWEAAGGFVEGIQQAPDYDMWVRLSERDPVGFVRQACVELRDHPLQLGRLGQKLVSIVEEEKMVYDRLRARLVPAAMSEGEFRSHWKTHRGCGHFHMATRALLRGQIRLAMRGYRTIGRYGSTVGQGWTWLRTGNGRLGTMSGPEFYDKIAGRFGNSRSSPTSE